MMSIEFQRKEREGHPENSFRIGKASSSTIPVEKKIKSPTNLLVSNDELAPGFLTSIEGTTNRLNLIWQEKTAWVGKHP